MEDNNDLKDLALTYVRRMEKISRLKDPIKAAFCFYDIVKTTYGFAKGSSIYDEEKEEIDNSLSVIKQIISVSLLVHGWSQDQVQEFQEKVDELTKID